MRRIEWASAARILGWLIGISLLVGAVIRMGIELELFGGLTEPPSEDFVDRILTVYTDVTNRWPVEFTSLTAFAIGFAGLASLGPVLARLASPADARGGIVMVAFLGLGGLGVASQLIQIGALPFLTNPELCDCALREEEIMAREVVINTIFGVQLWLVVGALVAGGAGNPARWIARRRCRHAVSLALAIAPDRPCVDRRLPCSRCWRRSPSTSTSSLRPPASSSRSGRSGWHCGLPKSGAHRHRSRNRRAGGGGQAVGVHRPPRDRATRPGGTASPPDGSHGDDGLEVVLRRAVGRRSPVRSAGHRLGLLGVLLLGAAAQHLQ